MSSFTDSPNRFGAPSPPPTSSPASSPSFGPCDSSPVSSPPLAPLSHSPPPSPGPAHPFAASTKAVRPPRLYEKRTPGRRLEFTSSLESDVFSLDDPSSHSRHTTSTAVPHDPLAGDANAAWTPPDWEKKSGESRRTLSMASASSSDFSISPAHLFSSKARPAAYTYDPDAVNLSEDEDDAQPVYHTRGQREKEVWERTIERAVNEANGVINLDNSGLISTPLTRIPPSIADLASLVVLQPEIAAPKAEFTPRARLFTRSVTVPTNPFHHEPFLAQDDHPRLLKSPSMAQLRPESKSSDAPVNSLYLSLAQNQITKLPLELFWLHGLVELNLRGNRLTRMPPQIAHLTNLQTLNIAQNRLTYLPAEMLDMRLASLVLQGNPWMQPPEGGAQDKSRVVTPVVSHFSVPSLAEYCLRTLLAENKKASLRPDSRPGETVLEDMHALPLPDDYPRWLLEDLRACCPRAVAKTDLSMQASPSKRLRRSASFVVDAPRTDAEDESAETHPGIGVCRSPVHTGGRAVFVRHAEERFSWEAVVAGQNAGVEGGVPVLWRGCSQGCLGFLDEA